MDWLDLSLKERKKLTRISHEICEREEQLVAKRFERKAPESGNYEFVQQVTKDKMLAEKDEELRRMQEMLAQMQVTMCWTHGCPIPQTISSHIFQTISVS